MTDQTSTGTTLTHGSKPWRLFKAACFLGPAWYEIATDPGRRITASMRALAALTPLELELLEVGQTYPISIQGGRGAVILLKMTKEQSLQMGLEEDGLIILAPNADGSTPPPEQHLTRAFCVPLTLHALLHSTPDPFHAADQCVMMLAAFAMLAHRDRLMTESRDRLLYECKDVPKRVLFAMLRDYRSSSMRARWSKVREILSHVYLAGAPLIARVTEEPGAMTSGELDPSISAWDLGPFARGEVEVWRVSRHVLEDASVVDAALANYERAMTAWRGLTPEQRAERRGASGTGALKHPEPVHPDNARCSARRATRLDPRDFEESAAGFCGLIPEHVHRAANAQGPKALRDLDLRHWEAGSGRSITRTKKRQRPSRRKRAAARVTARAIARGTFAHRLGPEGETLPITRERGRTTLLVFTSTG